MPNISATRAIGLGRYLGRAAGVVGIGIGLYSSVKTFRTYTKKNPYNELISSIEEDLDKWSIAINCIGRKPYEVGDICLIEEVNSITALGKRELLNYPNTKGYVRFNGPDMEFHVPPEFKYGQTNNNPSFIEPNPKTSKRLIEVALENLIGARDYNDIEHYLKKKRESIQGLTDINESLPMEYHGENYTPLQEELSGIARKMVIIEFELQSKRLKLESERGINRLKYLGLAGLSFFTGAAALKK